MQIGVIIHKADENDTVILNNDLESSYIPTEFQFLYSNNHQRRFHGSLCTKWIERASIEKSKGRYIKLIKKMNFDEYELWLYFTSLNGNTIGEYYWVSKQ